MRIPRSTKTKLLIFALLITAMVFCIFMLSSKLDIGRYIKWSRLYSESHLTAAVEAMEDYVSGGELSDWNAAAEQFHAYSVLITESDLRADMNPKLSSDVDTLTAQACYKVSEAMLINREAVLPYSGDILEALRLLKDDPNSPGAVKILLDIYKTVQAGGGQ